MQNVFQIVISLIFLIIGVLGLANKKKHGWNKQYPEIDWLFTYLVIFLSIILLFSSSINLACSLSS